MGIEDIITREDLEDLLREIGVGRYRLVEIRPASVVLLFTRPDKQEIAFKNISDRLPEGLGLFVGTLGLWECLLRRRQWHII